MSILAKRVIALLIPFSLALAWAGGEARKNHAVNQHLGSISNDIEEVVLVGEGLYQAHRKNRPNETLYLAHESRPGYGGPLKVAIAVDNKKIIQYVAVLESADTRSYLDKVVGLGLLDQFAGNSIEQMPEVDGISGATLSSAAIIQGVENAARKIGALQFNLPVVEIKPRTVTPETTKLVLICLFFAVALGLTSKKIKQKRKARAVLLLLSTVTLGFWLGAQFSISTIVSLLSGSWLKGMATYAALLCLVLAVTVFLVTKKNIFCNFICPFGAVQEGLGNITRCSPPEKSWWMDWIARAWVLAVLLAALYFQAPADAMYEPFSKTFNFIGSGIIYSLTILVVISSLVIKRPWCNLFCPAKVMFFYLQFTRKSFANPKRCQPVQIQRELKQ